MALKTVSASEFNERLLLTAISFLLIPFLILTNCHLLFWINVKPGAWTFPLDVLLVLPVVYCFSRLWLSSGFWKKSLLAWFISVGSAAVLMTVSYWFVDVSWDGQMYHQDGVIALARGWNPIKTYIKDTGFGEWVVNQFFSSAWVYEAAAYLFTGKLESAKFFNLFLALAATLFAWNTFNQLSSKSRWVNLLMAVILMFNPITILQFFCFYIDNQIYSLTVILLSLLVLEIRPETRFRKAYLLIGASVCMLISLKLPAIGFVLVYMGGFWIYLLLKKRFIELKRYTLIFSIIGVVALGVYGYHPFIRNIVNYGHPFYPMNKLDMLRDAQPADFVDKNRVRNFVVSVFSRSGATITPEKAQLKKPWDRSDLYAFQQPDSRTGGFGTYFGLCVLAMLVLWAATLLFRMHEMRYWYWFAGIVAVSVFIHPACWWARYVAQFYLIPVTLSWMVLVFSPLKKLKTVALLTTGFLGLNTLLVARENISYQLRMTKDVHDQMDGLKSIKHVEAYFGCFEANEVRFLEHGISVTRKTEPKLGCAIPFRMFGTPINSTIFCTESEKSDTLFCNADSLANNVLCTNKSGITVANEGNTVAINSFSAPNSVCLTAAHPFGFVTEIPCNSGEYYKISVKLYGKGNATLVTTFHDGTKFYRESVDIQPVKDRKDWNNLELQCWIPRKPADGKLKIYVYSSSQEPVYVDDMCIIRVLPQ
jgi:hypothetical protein